MVHLLPFIWKYSVSNYLYAFYRENYPMQIFEYTLKCYEMQSRNSNDLTVPFKTQIANQINTILSQFRLYIPPFNFFVL